MPLVTKTVLQRTVAEWVLRSDTQCANPFTDITLDATFFSPTGKTFTMPGFYDGERTWKVRFNPNEAGQWRYRMVSRPKDAELTEEGVFEVLVNEGRGFLRSTPGEGWGFTYESGEPCFVLGDTTYNLFGMAFCGIEVNRFMRRRKEQGFNMLRVRLPVSPFHPPDGYNSWDTRRTWPWGGSEQSPRFDRFNLDYFRTVDQVVGEAERLDLGLEMIMEAWGFEFPFNSRNIFTAEWEELWMRYLIARYDAFNCVYIWTPLNEYEYYPNGAFLHKPVADRWAMRIARWIKATAAHGHIVAMHNGPREPAFARRFAADPEAVDTILFQEWGKRDAQNCWLGVGIDEQIRISLAGWWGSAIFAEWGYERNYALPMLLPNHEHCDEEHTRRGAWRGAMFAMGLIHGFDNSWGRDALLEEDQPGLVYLQHVQRFFTEVVPFPRLRPADEVLVEREHPAGHRPLALASAERDLVVVYLPVGGSVDLRLPVGRRLRAQWFDPRIGALTAADARAGSETSFVAPPGGGERPFDWVLLLAPSEMTQVK